MKKILFLSITSIIILCTSCQEEFKNWYSATANYDGRFVVATACEEYNDDDTSIEDGLEVMIYNTSDNKENEIWIQFSVAGESIKGKFNLTGNFNAFTDSTTQVENIDSNTVYAFDNAGNIINVAGLGVPASAGLIADGVQLYTRITLIEGKILPKSATTIGGNISDSLYIKAILHHDYIEFESYEIDPADWDDPNVPEFDWQVKAGSNTPADDDGWDETWTLAGYRYTGYPEDIAH